MAHEINNPINSISLNAPLLQRIWQDLMPVLEERARKEPSRKYGGLSYPFLRENLGQLLGDLNLAANRITKLVTSLKEFALLRTSEPALGSPIVAVESAAEQGSCFFLYPGVGG
jgi:signal transduction histidine kinase